jgi:AcrR family transcriptional regulator
MDQDTRERILLAAEKVFSEKGQEAASVREILKNAGVKNIAAINYYFGDKDRLYIETVKNAHRTCVEGLPFPDPVPGVPATTQLRGFIRTMVDRMLRPQRASALILIMRELSQPSQACAEVVREYIQPIAARLQGILDQLMPEAPYARKFMTAFSIVGQCMEYRLHRPVMMLLMGEENFKKITAEQIAEHIAEFTLKGLGGTAETAAEAGK